MTKSELLRFAWIFSLLSFAPFLRVNGSVGQSVEDGHSDPLIKCWSRSVSVSKIGGLSINSSYAYILSTESRIIAFDLRSGELSWATEIGGTERSELLSTERFIVIVTSRRNDNGEYKGAAQIRVLDSTTGLVKWSRELSEATKFYLGKTSKGLVVISNEGGIWLLDDQTGSIVWQRSFEGGLSATPRIGENGISIGTNNKRIQVFDVANGDISGDLPLEFKVDKIGDLVDSQLLFSDNRGTVFSTDRNGNINWRFRAGGRIAELLAMDNDVLVASADNFVYLMSAGYGNIKWKRRLPGRLLHGIQIEKELAVFTVVGDESAYLIDLSKGKIIKLLALSEGADFLPISMKSKNGYLVMPTQKGMIAFSSTCQK